MSLILGSIFLGSLLIVSIRLNGIFFPASLMLLVWIFDFIFQYVSGYYDINCFTIVFITLIISYYTMGSFLGMSLKYKKSEYLWSEKKLTHVIFFISVILIIFIPATFVDIYPVMATEASNIPLAIRQYYVSSASTPLSIKISANFSVVLIILLYKERRLSKYFKFCLIIFALVGVILPFSKGYLLMLLCYLFSISIFNADKAHMIIFKNKTKLEHVKPIFIIFCYFCLGVVVFLLSATVRDSIAVEEYLRIYILSSIPAFQLILNDEFRFPFPTLFGFMRPIYQSVGIKTDHIIDDNFVNVPDPTNVFTAFGPAFSDYGLLFTVLYFTFNGFISGLIFKLAKRDYIIAKIIYGFIIFAIIASIFSDGFVLWSTIINYLLIFIVINFYVRTKKNVFKPSGCY